jgi:ketosteroid isomerase-like protein
MKKITLLLFAFAISNLLLAQQNDSTNIAKEEMAVKNVVKQFLTAAGNYDIDAMPSLFTENANIAGASLKNEKWNTYNITLEEFMAMLRSRTNPTKYTEPVSKFIVHMSEGKLAFVKADATLIFEGKAQRHNFDYFTLIKENNIWKIVNGSYVSIPIKD